LLYQDGFPANYSDEWILNTDTAYCNQYQ